MLLALSCALAYLGFHLTVLLSVCEGRLTGQMPGRLWQVDVHSECPCKWPLEDRQAPGFSFACSCIFVVYLLIINHNFFS